MLLHLKCRIYCWLQCDWAQRADNFDGVVNLQLISYCEEEEEEEENHFHRWSNVECPFAKDTLGGVVSSELGWGLILYGEEEEDYLATTEGFSHNNVKGN